MGNDKRRLGGEGPDLHPLDAARVGVEHFIFEFPRSQENLAAVRNAARRRGDKPPDCVHLLRLGKRREIEAGRLGDGVEGGSRLGDPSSVP